jgi:AcrR family transcriptional regulator
MGIYKEKREYTKNILIDSFWEIYKKKSIDKITVKEITDRAGYNRATFYIHFKDVNDVLQCIEDKLYEDFDTTFKNSNIESYSQEELLKNAFNLFSVNEGYYRVLLSSKGDPYFVAKSKEKLMGLFHSFSKKNSTLTEKSTDFIMEYITGGLISCILYWFEVKPFSEEELLIHLYKLIESSAKLH